MLPKLCLVSVLFIVVTVPLSSENVLRLWDDTEPFGRSPSETPLHLRLPPEVAPSFYRLKLIANLDNASFTGQVAITLRASKAVKDIILHSKNLTINTKTVNLTEQIYEKVATINSRSKRQDVVASKSALDTGSPDNGATTNSTTISTASSNETSTPAATSSTAKPPTVDNQVTHSNAQSVSIMTVLHSPGDRLAIILTSALKPDVDYILELSFEGKIGDKFTGFYRSTYKSNNTDVPLGVTQFEPTSAREAFPCFDEPAFKAKFEISIAHAQNLSVLSNMKIAAEEPMDGQPNWVWTHFERSVKMSTYLVAYVLSDYKSIQTSYLSKDGANKTIKVWTRPELINKANYALAITPKLLAYYEDVFGVPYALDKMDLIGIPDFSTGAMENWGLITFRETALLFDEAEGTARDKQNVAIDVAHELAHQWFGNLVTMRWWADLWLNEGFATYVEYLGVDRIGPEWKIFETFSRDKMTLLHSDALKNTSPVAREVIDASEISQKFDEISYTKGATLIRMLNHTLSEELFHKGLMRYLNDWKFSNAEENDLWAAMAQETAAESSLQGLSLVQFMNSWTRQPGYPVVKVNRNYKNGVVEMEQRLFTSAKQPYQAMVDQLWQIPVSYTTLDVPVEQWSTKPKVWLNSRAQAISSTINATQALYVNVDAIGYYRVNYDKKNWELLAAALKSGRVQSPITKSQLIDDAFNLAKASLLDYSYALRMTTCVIDGEDSRIVWDLLLNNMGFLKYNLKATPGYVYFQDYMMILLKKQLEKLNYGLEKPKDDNQAFLIENLVTWECYVESTRCRDWARQQFDSWAAQADLLANNPIPSHLRQLVYSMALRQGGRREFELLWNVFQNSTDPNVKSLIINVLPSTREESLIATLLEKSLSEIPKQYALAAWAVEPPIGVKIAQDFLIANFDRVYDKFADMDPFIFPIILHSVFGCITTDDELNRLKVFALEHKAKLVSASQMLQKLVDTATVRIAWVNKYARQVNRWFEDYVTGKLLPDGTPIPSPTTAENGTATTAVPLNTTDSTIPTTTTTSPTQS